MTRRGLPLANPSGAEVRWLVLRVLGRLPGFFHLGVHRGSVLCRDPGCFLPFFVVRDLELYDVSCRVRNLH